MTQVQHVCSAIACAVVVHLPDYDTVIVSFRGTKDPVDVLTDIHFLATPFFSRMTKPPRGENDGDEENEGMLVHAGFKNAFESIRLQLAEVLVDEDGLCESEAIFVGHSMGGALAQLAAAYFADLKPRSVWLLMRLSKHCQQRYNDNA